MSAVSALRRSPVLLVRSAESRCTSREEKRYDAVSASLTARSSIRSNGSVPSLRQSGFCLRHAPSLSVTKRYGPVPVSYTHLGQIVVALLGDEATVKTLKRKGSEVWLMPANPDYQPIDGRECTILGLSLIHI